MTTLVADVGGTNTRVALFTDAGKAPQEVRRFRNETYGSLEGLLRSYLDDLDNPACDAACVAVAGPVRDGKGQLTNLDWRIDVEGLSAETGAARAFVINDLEAQGHALEDVETRRLIGSAAADPAHGSRLVVGMGTGFNAAPVHAIAGGGEYQVVPSECGHISLPVWDDTSYELSKTLVDSHGFASVEEALSGRGLLALNAFATRKDGGGAHETTRDLIDALSDNPAAADRETAHLVCQILGRVLGDLALVHLPWGGIYLIGGLARALAPFFDSYGLAEGFHDKGRFRSFMQDFAILIVEDDYAALAGCARYVHRQG